MAKEWVVLLEVERHGPDGAVAADDVEALLQAVGKGPYGRLHCPDRYALQVTAPGSSPVEALVDVLSRWSHAVHHLGLPLWEVVRTEVMTPEEFDRDCQSAQRDELAGSRSIPGLVDREHAAAEQLLHQAFSDPVTGLLGPEAFAYGLDAALVGPGGRSVGVVCLDLDGFRSVSHLSGVHADDLSAVVAHRLSAIVRRSDALARLGADQYVLLLTEITEKDALCVADRMIDAVHRPIEMYGRELTISGCTGVAMSHAADGAAAVVRDAQAALSQARAAGAGRPMLRSPDGL